MLATLALAALATPDLLDVHPLLGPYLEIQDAVLAAADGDTIRVAPGVYGSFAIRGKSLAVIAPDGAQVLGGPVRIQELGPGQWAVLDNFSLRTTEAQEDAPLIIGLNQGSVRCSRVEAGGQSWTSTSGIPMGAVVRVLSSSDVVLTDCDFHGAYQGGVPDPGLRPLDVRDASVSLFRVRALAIDNAPTWRPTAVHASNSVLELHGSLVRGGQGISNGPDPAGFACVGFASPGGDGIEAHDTLVRSFGSTIVGGHGGTDYCFIGPYDPSFPGSAPTGVPIDLNGASTVTQDSTVSAFLDAPVLVPEGGSFAVQASAAPTDIVMLVSGTRAARRPIPGYLGALLLGGPVGAVQRRVIGIGSPAASVAAPVLPAFSTAEIHLQTVALRDDPGAPSGRTVLFGGARAVIVVDSAY